MRFIQLFLLGALLTNAAQAASILTFNWNDLAVGNYYLDVQMASGDGLFGNNFASIKNITGQNVTFAPPALLNGWASEPQSSVYQITDDDPSLAGVPDILNGILLAFAVDSNGPGSFQMQLESSNAFSGAGLQDSLTIAILNESFFSIYEDGGIGLPMLTFLFDGDGSLEVIANASNVAPYDTIAAPQVAENTIPEPSTWAGAAAGLVALALWKKRRDAALLVCAIVVPASAQQAWLVKDTNFPTGFNFTMIYGDTFAQFGNDIVFAGISGNFNERNRGLYKYNTVSRQGARFATLPVAMSKLGAASKGLVFQVEGQFGMGSLWVSDGTFAGTRQAVPSLNMSTNGLRLPNGILLFSGQSTYGGNSELWRSDGTIAGTYRIAQQVSMYSAVIFNGQAFFFNNQQLWKSDGTEQGTGFALSGVAGLESTDSALLVERAGLLYFIGCQAATGCEFWSTNGTAQGTQLAAEIIAGPERAYGVRSVGVFNSEIYFTFTYPVVGAALWKTNGTTAGTGLVKTVVPDVHPVAIGTGVALNNALVFPVRDSGLWRTDGTEAGTFGLGVATGSIVRINAGTALFPGETTAEGIELWKTDGTLAGTSIVKDLLPGPGRGLGQARLFGVDGKVFFNGAEPQTGAELWESDGTPAGTKLAFDFTKPGGGFHPQPMVTLNGVQYFQASGEPGYNIYRTDGTAAGTIKCVTVPGTFDKATGLFSFGDQIIFALFPQSGGPQIWKTNGTQQGTSKIGEVPGIEFTAGVRSGDRFYFEVFEPTIGFEAVRVLYVTDGVTITALKSTPSSQLPLYTPRHAPFGQRSLMFVAGESLDEMELYATDGTPQGTGLVANLDPSGSSYPQNLVHLNGMVYFTATVSGVKKVFRSNGTLHGTTDLRNLPSGSSGPYLSDGNAVDLFVPTADDGLLRFDSATNQWTSLNVAASSLFVTRNGITYFMGSAPPNGFAVFRTDGTAGGTHMVGNGWLPNPNDGFASAMFWHGNHLYLEATVGLNQELWRTDGMSNPVMPWQINPQTASIPTVDSSGFATLTGSGARFLGELPNGRALLSADDGVRGRELWALDDAPCIAAPDVNSQLTITAPAPSINRLTGRGVQTVRIVNNGAALNNVAYIASGLNAQHDIWNRHGVTQCFAPAGPYRDIGSIGAGQTVTLTLEFFIKPGVSFSYTPKVIARDGAR